jgi:hypothetical protein
MTYTEIGPILTLYGLLLMMFGVGSAGMCLWLVFEIRSLPIRAVNVIRILNAIEAVRIAIEDSKDYTEPRLDAVNQRLDNLTDMINVYVLRIGGASQPKKGQ